MERCLRQSLEEPKLLVAKCIAEGIEVDIPVVTFSTTTAAMFASEALETAAKDEALFSGRIGTVKIDGKPILSSMLIQIMCKGNEDKISVVEELTNNGAKQVMESQSSSSMSFAEASIDLAIHESKSKFTSDQVEELAGECVTLQELHSTLSVGSFIDDEKIATEQRLAEMLDFKELQRLGGVKKSGSKSALRIALKKRHFSIIKCLIENGAQVTGSDLCHLCLSAADLCKLAIERQNIDDVRSGPSGLTPWHVAKWSGRDEIAILLEKIDPDIRFIKCENQVWPIRFLRCSFDLVTHQVLWECKSCLSDALVCSWCKDHCHRDHQVQPKLLLGACNCGGIAGEHSMLEVQLVFEEVNESVSCTEEFPADGVMQFTSSDHPQPLQGMKKCLIC